MADKPYPTDLTDQQWELIRPLLEHNHGQRGQQHYSLRRIVDGCFYVLRGGIRGASSGAGNTPLSATFKRAHNPP